MEGEWHCGREKGGEASVVGMVRIARTLSAIERETGVARRRAEGQVVTQFFRCIDQGLCGEARGARAVCLITDMLLAFAVEMGWTQHRRSDAAKILHRDRLTRAPVRLSSDID
jgi:hypothetical protein